MNGLPLFELTLAECEASIGDRGAAISRMRELEARGDYISPYWRARAWVRAEEHDRALALLEESVEAREWFVILLAHEPAFDPLRDDVRFSRLLARVGLPSLIVQVHGIELFVTRLIETLASITSSASPR